MSQIIKIWQNKKKRVESLNAGFSLVELIVVVAIMAVLMTILAPNVIRYVDRARRQTELSNVHTMLRCVEYMAFEDHYDSYMDMDRLQPPYLCVEIPPKMMLEASGITAEEYITFLSDLSKTSGKRSVFVDFVTACGGMPESILGGNYGYEIMVDSRNARPVVAITQNMDTMEIYLLYPESDKFLNNEPITVEEQNQIMQEYEDSLEE